MKKIKIISLTLLVISGLTLLAIRLDIFSNKHKNQTLQPTHVEVIETNRKDMPYVLKLAGTAQAYNTVEIKSLVTGQIKQINFQEGQKVKLGDLLFQIDSRNFEYQLRQAQASLLRDQVQLEHAKQEAKRYQKLFEQNAVSEEQYMQILTNANVLKAAIEADQAAIDSAKLQIEYSKILAPIDGRTGEILFQEGNLAQVSTNQPLVTINTISPIHVTFSVPAQYLNIIRKSKETKELTINIHTSSNQEIKDAEIVFIDNAIDHTTNTIKLKALATNDYETLWPGEFVKVSLSLYTKKNAIVIPVKALQINQTGYYVFVIGQDNKAIIRNITVEFSDDHQAVIAEGLIVGEMVVINGQLHLNQGKMVAPKVINNKD